MNLIGKRPHIESKCPVGFRKSFPSCIAVIICPNIFLAIAIGYLDHGTWFLELNLSFVVTITDDE